jgi:ParB/RepB/Spo0J family partition protein
MSKKNGNNKSPPIASSRVLEFDPGRVRPLAGQPRKRFAGIKQLAASIAEVGQSTPGIVILLEDKKSDCDFDAQLVDGARRLRACKSIGRKFRAEVRGGAGLDDLFVASFAANFGKQNHDAIEIAEALGRIQKMGKTIEQMARIAGKSVSWAASHLNLLKLDPAVQRMMMLRKKNKSHESMARLTFSLAQLLVPLEPGRQIELARKITSGDGMTLLAARRLILKIRSKSGDEHAYSGGRRGPGRNINTLESTMTDFSNRVGIYLDMPGAQLGPMIDGLGAAGRRRMAERIEKLAEELGTLAEMIRERIKKNLAVPQRSSAE